MKESICLLWDVLHFVGFLLVITFPVQTSIIGLIIGFLWKREIEVSRNILCFVLWWSIVNMYEFKLGIISTFTLFLSSPRIFHEMFNNTLTVHCTWILNLLYPILYQNQIEPLDCMQKNVVNSGTPSVSIILCNKDESMDTIKKSITSIVSSKTYAEKHLQIQHIRLILCDGGSKNIQELRSQCETQFDSIEIIPGGKLSGRHICSLRETSDILVAYDSDRKYDIKSTYAHLQPFVQGWKNCTRDIGSTMIEGIVGTTHYPYSDGIFPFNGGNSAYLRVVYLRYPFDTTINQTTTSSIWKEEELDWGSNLMKCGNVLSVPSFYTDINPLPLVPFLKRMLNLKNSFIGGGDRWTAEETTAMIICKTVFISAITILVSMYNFDGLKEPSI